MAKKYYSESKFIESGGQSMEIIILRPGPNKKPKEETPLILWIHGGGYVVGMARMIYMSRAKKLCEKYGAVVITPEYRLAKKSPYPAALDDCYNTLLYIKDNHDSLGGNPSKIMAVEEKWADVKAYVVGDSLKEIVLKLGDLTDNEREIILKGCLINYYRG